MIHEIQHRRNHERARDYTDHQRHLLLPWRRINELAGLEILQVIVGDCGNVENHCGGESANAISALPASGDTYGFTPNTSSSAAPITTKMPMPDSGLLEEPIRPAM